jgi:hypothetical protein
MAPNQLWVEQSQLEAIKELVERQAARLAVIEKQLGITPPPVPEEAEKS